MEDKKIIGKKSRAAGQRFELKVRSDLEEKGWIVAKWTNNVEFMCTYKEHCCARLVKVKNKFLGPGRPMMLGAGFPDFIAFTKKISRHEIDRNAQGDLSLNKDPYCDLDRYYILGVESKMNGYLDQQEKEKCKWLLDNHIFHNILIASKGTKRGQIVYKEFK